MSDSNDDMKKVVKSLAEGKFRMAPSEGVSFFKDIASKFLNEVLGHPEAFISDYSHASDFDKEDSVIIEKTKASFGVDITSVIDKPLVEIFEYLEKNSPNRM